MNGKQLYLRIMHNLAVALEWQSTDYQWETLDPLEQQMWEALTKNPQWFVRSRGRSKRKPTSTTRT